MKLSKEEARDILCDSHEDWENISEKCTGERRWVNCFTSIFRHVPTDVLYGVDWERGKTEYQDEQPFEYSEPDFYEVEAVEVKKIVYKRKAAKKVLESSLTAPKST